MTTSGDGVNVKLALPAFSPWAGAIVGVVAALNGLLLPVGIVTLVISRGPVALLAAKSVPFSVRLVTTGSGASIVMPPSTSCRETAPEELALLLTRFSGAMAGNGSKWSGVNAFESDEPTRLKTLLVACRISELRSEVESWRSSTWKKCLAIILFLRLFKGWEVGRLPPKSLGIT